MTREFKNKVREQFGRAADGYIHDKGFATGDDLETMVRLLHPMPDDNMLDVACGGGHTALRFSPLVRSVVASDLTMVMLKKAQEYISEEGGVDNITFREADAEDLPFPAGAFTLLTCRVAPHHFPDVARALSEFHRVLRRGGRIAIVDTVLPNDPEIAEWYQEHGKDARPDAHPGLYRDSLARNGPGGGIYPARNRHHPENPRFSDLGETGRAEP